MNRDLNYYLCTIVLKIRGLFYATIDKAGGVYVYRSKLSTNYIQNLQNDGTFQNGRYDPFYFSYCFFHHPDELSWTLAFNQSNIPRGSRLSAAENVVNPLFPAYYALVCFNHFHKTKDEESLNKFWDQVHFLEKTGEETPNEFFLWIDIPVPAFQLTRPFYNGITQALCLSCFIRAYQLSNEKRYRELSDKIFKTFFLPFEDGGVLFYTEKGLPWILEYPSEQPPLVLNGFITTIIGILEYLQAMGANDDRQMINELLQSLWQHLPDFKRGRYFKYAMKYNRLSNISYRGLYPTLFLHLYSLTGHAAFLEMSRTLYMKVPWKNFFRFYRIPIEREAELKKIFYKNRTIEK